MLGLIKIPSNEKIKFLIPENLLAILYEDQTFEIFDLEFDLENSIFRIDLSIFGQALQNFFFPTQSRISTSLQQLTPVFIDNRHRLFALGPLLLPKLCLSAKIREQIKALPQQDPYIKRLLTLCDNEGGSRVKSEECLEFYGLGEGPGLRVLVGLDYWPKWGCEVEERLRELKMVGILEFAVIEFAALGTVVVVVHEGNSEQGNFFLIWSCCVGRKKVT